MYTIKVLQHQLRKLIDRHLLMQYFEILKYCNDEAIQKTNDALHQNKQVIQDLVTVSVQENETLVVLASRTQQDSRTMKTLTVVASLYLPAASVASIFNSNLIMVNKEKRVVAASNFWMFPIFAIALTMIIVIPARICLHHSTKKG